EAMVEVVAPPEAETTPMTEPTPSTTAEAPPADAPLPEVRLVTIAQLDELVKGTLGKVTVLNIWATWCVPCRLEMPALDALQKELGDKDFEVVAVNIDTRNPEKPKQFLKEIKVERLAYYADPKAKIFQDLKTAGRAFGMPTTLLVDPQGCELAYLAGPAEWASGDALAFVKAAKAR
ncbi:MAG TPA: TlpA disulfide reductase family protein, partial [Rhabdaerophilum sp.]|nr:TlpA disulfide reductase family protein [Rhabdaerophilum sp.]